jgi:hypothetical protein
MYQLRGLWWRAHAHERTRREVAPSVVLLDYRPFSATTSSTSIGEPQGSSTTPTAVRAWRPFSPKSSPIKSAAPFITSGWPVKPSAEATSSTETSRPTLPVYGSCPSLEGSWPAVKSRAPPGFRGGRSRRAGVQRGARSPELSACLLPLRPPSSTPLRTRPGRRAGGSSVLRRTRRR